ncbi:hypothetical protein LTR62_002988 [Meristemomyces frigidus]|uniref:Uncharacterized protein n=1 Tax=Meristemomyces frigidus TaxID=1508187 RepID=A0AAN7TY85_9PEZI|nr:hypothetical protein LTR62_002988 [Meristemomyces frigidus]
MSGEQFVFLALWTSSSLSFTMLSFALDKAVLESEGIYVGGWDPRGALWPKKVNGKTGKSSKTRD